MSLFYFYVRRLARESAKLPLLQYANFNKLAAAFCASRRQKASPRNREHSALIASTSIKKFRRRARAFQNRDARRQTAKCARDVDRRMIAGERAQIGKQSVRLLTVDSGERPHASEAASFLLLRGQKNKRRRQ